jgi:hypothetical protein
MPGLLSSAMAESCVGGRFMWNRQRQLVSILSLVLALLSRFNDLSLGYWFVARQDGHQFAVEDIANRLLGEGSYRVVMAPGELCQRFEKDWGIVVVYTHWSEQRNLRSVSPYS